MSSSFTMVEKNAEQMQKFASQVGKGMEVAIKILDDLTLLGGGADGSSGGENGLTEFSERKIKELQNEMMEFIKLEEESRIYLQAVEALKIEVQQSGDENLDLSTCLDRQLRKPKRSSNYETHPKYREFNEIVQELRNPEDAMATPSTVNDDDGDELMMTEETISTLDPITRQEIVIAVRNKKCNHLYDERTITAHIQARKGKVRCPIGGCGNTSLLSMEDLVPDRKMQKYIDRKKRRGQ